MWIILVGYSTIALGGLFFFIPSLPEIIYSVSRKENIPEDSDSLNDKAAGIFNCFYSLGAIIAPILGGLLNDTIGYRSTNDVMAGFVMVFLVFYVLLNTKRKEYRILNKDEKKKSIHIDHEQKPHDNQLDET